jgi:hypothetical protein
MIMSSIDLNKDTNLDKINVIACGIAHSNNIIRLLSSIGFKRKVFEIYKIN